jgi:integrase
MARKSFQKGTVIERRYDYGTTYIARWREKNPEGRWKEKTKTLRDCPDKKSAQKELDQILRDINRRNGVAAYRANVRFNEVLGKHWPNYLKSADVKPSTQGAWESSIRNWVKPFFGKMLLSDIGPAEVGDFMAHLATNDLSPKYRKNLYNLIHLIFDVALENELLEATPVRPKLHRPKVPRKERKLLSVDQVRAFLKALQPPWRTPIFVLAMTRGSRR